MRHGVYETNRKKSGSINGKSTNDSIIEGSLKVGRTKLVVHGSIVIEMTGLRIHVVVMVVMVVLMRRCCCCGRVRRRGGRGRGVGIGMVVLAVTVVVDRERSASCLSVGLLDGFWCVFVRWLRLSCQMSTSHKKMMFMRCMVRNGGVTDKKFMGKNMGEVNVARN